jgi:hypothetical protein
VPGDCVVEAVIAPEQFTVDDEGRRTEDAEGTRCFRSRSETFDTFGPVLPAPERP